MSCALLSPWAIHPVPRGAFRGNPHAGSDLPRGPRKRPRQKRRTNNPKHVRSRTAMAVLSMKSLLEAGVHFGHQTKRWNPKMRPYIFGARSGIYIVDLQKTAALFDEAYHFVNKLASKGERVLFVGTKKNAQDIVKE